MGTWYIRSFGDVYAVKAESPTDALGEWAKTVPLNDVSLVVVIHGSPFAGDEFPPDALVSLGPKLLLDASRITGDEFSSAMDRLTAHGE